MGKYNLDNLKTEVEAAAKRLNIAVDIEQAAAAIAAAFDRMLSGSFPTVGKDGALLREELLSQFYNAGLGMLVARFVVAQGNVNSTIFSEGQEEAYENMVEARNYLFLAISVKMRKMRIFNVDEGILWNILLDVSRRITTILPKTSVLIG